MYTKPAAETMSPVNETIATKDDDEHDKDSSEVDWATVYESQFTAQHGQRRPVVWVDGVDVSHLSDVSQYCFDVTWHRTYRYMCC